VRKFIRFRRKRDPLESFSSIAAAVLAKVCKWPFAGFPNVGCLAAKFKRTQCGREISEVAGSRQPKLGI